MYSHRVCSCHVSTTKPLKSTHIPTPRKPNPHHTKAYIRVGEQQVGKGVAPLGSQAHKVLILLDLVQGAIPWGSPIQVDWIEGTLCVGMGGACTSVSYTVGVYY